MFVCRSAVESDIDSIVCFNLSLAEETESRGLDFATVHRGVTRGMQFSPEVRYFVAEADTRVIAQIMLTREWSDWRDGWMVWLQSVYVAADWRGRGVFRQLFHYAADQVMKDSEVACFRLYLEKHNTTARQTYSRLGFTDADYEVMEMSVSQLTTNKSDLPRKEQ